LSDFRPTATWTALQQRARLLQTVRGFFAARGFVEVETPLLSADVVVDEHLDPLPVTLFADPRTPQVGPTYWLQTSPEFAMKRLLAAFAGEHSAQQSLAIYQIAKAFRGGERGTRHNPEFTLIEWYRVGDDYAAGMQLLSELAEATLNRGPAERITYREAFLRHASIDPFTANEVALRVRVTELDGAAIVPQEVNRDWLIDWLLVRHIEPQLGRARPTILYDYPADQAALARLREETFPVAERFELYVDGVELANGYHELLDAEVLRQRNRSHNAARGRAGKYTLPEESRLLAAMEHGLLPCAGCALGLDRLAMLVAGAKSLAEVIAFPIDRA
jgi:lysyl-tRNA synthetase class 2